MISKNARKLLRNRDRRKQEGGFTLVELLVVLVILVLLAGIVGPKVMGYLGSSKVKVAKIQISGLSNGLSQFYIDVGRYPTAAEGLSVLVKAPGNIPGWNGPYLEKNDVPLDPWGKPFIYTPGQNGGTPAIKSLGADGKEGGADENADVTN